MCKTKASLLEREIINSSGSHMNKTNFNIPLKYHIKYNFNKIILNAGVTGIKFMSKSLESCLKNIVIIDTMSK